MSGWDHPERRDIMITQPGTRPQFLHCNDVVITIGGGDSHYEMVDQLRRAAWRRLAEDQRTRVGSWLRSATGSN
jgi:hypothetical protein